MNEYKKGTTDKKRTTLRKEGGEEPKSARANWQLWKLCQELNPEEIVMLITKRRKELKYETDLECRNKIKSDILLLEDAYRIIKRKR